MYTNTIYIKVVHSTRKRSAGIKKTEEQSYCWEDVVLPLDPLVEGSSGVNTHPVTDSAICPITKKTNMFL